MPDPTVQPDAVWQVVQTDAGPITVVPIGDLQTRAKNWRDWATNAKASALALRSQAEDRWAAAGATLVAQSAEWVVPAELQAAVQRSRSVTEQIAADDQTAAALKDEESSAGVIGRIGVRHHEHQVEGDRSTAAAQLRQVLIPIARSAPATTILEAENERKAAAGLESQAAALESQVQAAQNWASAIDGEVERRHEAIRAMGFDSLYETALLQTSGAPSVDSPLVLKKGEQAYLSVPATLARMTTRTHYVGRSSGFSFPIGHTGIRYRVGGFRGEPVHQQSLTKLDVGTFVLTNQRAAYVGQTKSTSTPLNKVLHVEVYDDAISLEREGRENPDFYLMERPKYAVFVMNWALSKQAVS
jgi:hypothetical protein